MSLFSPLLIICVDQEKTTAASQLARELGFPDAHIVGGGFPEAVRSLSLRTSSPEYIIIDVGKHESEIFPEIDEFAMHCDAGVRVVVTGETNDIDFYRGLKMRGVLEYFTQPVKPSDIRAFLIQGSANFQNGTGQEENGTVISCMSAASGDGASTLATNLAYCLGKEFSQSVVLVDMDYQFGLICKSLDLAAPFGIRELFDNPDRGLDELLVSKMLVNYKDHMNIIAAPVELRLLPTIRPEIIRELITILRSKYRFVIIDVPHVWTDWTAAALTYSDHVVIVAQLWLRSLTHLTRLLSAWQTIGVQRDNTSLVINRSGAKFKEAVTTRDFERISRRKIDFFISNDVKAITRAETEAQTLFDSPQNSEPRKQIYEMAQKLAMRYVGEAALKSAKGKPPKKGILALQKVKRPS